MSKWMMGWYVMMACCVQLLLLFLNGQPEECRSWVWWLAVVMGWVAYLTFVFHVYMKGKCDGLKEVLNNDREGGVEV